MADYLYHIATSADWQHALEEGVYITASLAEEGFIHCSQHRQVLGTAARFYSGRKDLMLLLIDQNRVAAKVLYEPADGDTFPHIYGPVALDAVVQDFVFKPDDAGNFTMPGDLPDGP
jgi:uncharacterized protein (DUF952 family)